MATVLPEGETKPADPKTLQVPASTADCQALTPLQAMQRQFSLLNMDGKLWLVDRFSIDRLTAQGVAAKLSLSNLTDGALLIRRALKAQFPEDDADKVMKIFWISPHTICSSGVEFNPAGTSEHYLNLWVGPTIIPIAGSWTLISGFLLEVICSGDKDCFQYLISYIAHALQRPWEKPGVLIAMLSGQGTGKGTVAKILRKIWSATFLHVHNIDAVTGNFNASLERAFIVFMDEALFSGDRRAADALKSLVTEPVIQINEKHQPARQTSSYHRFFAATNAEHFKNTDRDDRRDFVLRVSEARKGDHEYWQALNAEIDSGGVEAMVHELLAMDLSGFNVRSKPNTKELLEQKLQSLGPIQRWWHDALYRGNIFNDTTFDKDDLDTVPQDITRWPHFISTARAIEGVMFVAGGRAFRKPSAFDLVKTFKEMCPSAPQQQKAFGGARHRGFALPSLEQARSDFEAYIGASVKWPEDEQ